MTKKIIIIAIIYIVFFQLTNSQYHLSQTQLTRNEVLINPAYTASKNYYTFAANARKQWVGIDGSPSTQSITAYGPIRNKNIGLGLNITNDAIGVTNQQLINLSYGYRINFYRSFLCMGLNIGSKFLTNHYEDLNLDTNSDSYFSDNSTKFLVPYAGFGVYYEKEKYNLGLAIPIFLQNTIVQNDVAVITENSAFLFLTGNYLVKLKNGWILKNGALIKGAINSNFEFDVVETLYINDQWNFGLIYKSLNAVSIQLEYGHKKSYYFTYSYDISTSKIIYQQGGTHEITLTYLLDLNKKHLYTNPRYF